MVFNIKHSKTRCRKLRPSFLVESSNINKWAWNIDILRAKFVMGATLQTAFTVFSILLFVILATQVAAQVSNQVFVVLCHCLIIILEFNRRNWINPQWARRNRSRADHFANSVEKLQPKRNRRKMEVYCEGAQFGKSRKTREESRSFVEKYSNERFHNWRASKKYDRLSVELQKRGFSRVRRKKRKYSSLSAKLYSACWIPFNCFKYFKYV